MNIFTATAMAMAISAPVANANTNTNFSDVSATNSHFNAIQSLAERGIINGYEDGTYRPNVVLTRAQAAKILAEVLNLDTRDTKSKFNDVSATSGYAGAINALAKKEIISGYEDGTFKPNSPLTREQMAKIIVKAFKLEQSTTLSHSFKDVSETNGYKYFIQTLVDHNITQGTTPTTFAPSETVKRGQMASFVVRAEQASKKEKDVAEVELVIKAVKGNKVITDEGTLELDSSLANILSESNSESLQNAVMKSSVEQGRITDIHMLTIRASGTKEKPVVFDGKNETFNGLISVVGNAVEIKNLKLTKDFKLGGSGQTFVKLNTIEITGKLIVVENDSKVASLYPVSNSEPIVTYQIENSKIATVDIGRNNITIDANENSAVGHVTVNNNVKDVTLNGKFEKLTLQSLTTIQLLGKATVAQLVVTNFTAKIHLPTTMKIKQIVLPADANIASIIENYNEVRGNIESVNGGATSNVTGDNNSSGGTNTWTPSPTPKPEVPKPEVPKPEEPKPMPPSIGGQPLDPGTEQLPGKPQAPMGQVITSTIVDITVTTGDSSLVTTGDTSSVTTSEVVQAKLADGQTYFVESKLGSFMKNNKGALGGAKISVIINNGQIEAIKDLELEQTNATLIDGGEITIYGTLKVSKNIEKIMNVNVTENVILAANMTEDVLFIKTTIFGKVEFEKATAFAKRSLLASNAQVAAATTRIKITFTDSTIAIIEIAKKDVEVYAGGTTEVSNIRLFSNTVLGAELNDGKILPKIVVGQGVTNVTINASIANVVIETDENVIIDGRGNFDEVIVNTSKEVAINTVGTINNLNIKDDKPKVSLGEQIESVGQVTTVLPFEEVFKNYEELKGKVGQVVLPDSNFFAAELVKVEERFGYFTIKLAGTGSYSVKYQIIGLEDLWKLSEIEVNKTKVSGEAISYKVGEQIAIPGNKNLIVYLVDDSGIIKDYEKNFINRDTIRFTSTTAGIKIETTYDVKDGSSVADVYRGIFRFYENEPIVYLGTGTIGNYTWSKVDNLGVTYVQNTDIFKVDASEHKTYDYEFTGNIRNIPGSGYGTRIIHLAKDTTLQAIKKLYELSKNDAAPQGLVGSAINLAFSVYLNQKDNIVPYNSDAEEYRSAAEKATTLEELYDLIVQVNNSK